MIVVDNFCWEFEAHLARAEEAVYRDMNFGPAFYGGISLNSPSACAYERFEALLAKKPVPVIEYYRRYERGMVNQTFIHSDAAVSEWTAVLSLRDDNGALCFWRHLALDWIKPDHSDLDGVALAAQDGFDEAKWHMIHKVDLARNRCVIYPAAVFHSRWPKDWDLETARHIHVFFFNC